MSQELRAAVEQWKKMVETAKTGTDLFNASQFYRTNISNKV